MAFPYEDQTENESAVVNKDATTNGCKDNKNNDAVIDLVTINSDQSKGSESCVITVDQNGEQTKTDSNITRCCNSQWFFDKLIEGITLIIWFLVVLVILSYLWYLDNQSKPLFEK